MVKEFPGHDGSFKGTVVSYSDRLYHVEYEDGDEEGLDAREISFWLEYFSG